MWKSAAAAVLSSALFSTSGAVELSKESWDSSVAGKTVFVKFFAPWCGHCKNMKPAWDKLMAEYEGSKTILVADVDCTGAGKSKCDEVGVKGFPTIKYGDPSDLKDYKGGRSFDDLKKHAETLGPQCGPANLDLCDAEKKQKIEGFMALSAQERYDLIKSKDDAIEKLESEFKAFVEGLSKQYQEKSDQKDKAVAEIKDSGLGLLKAVHNHAKAQEKGEL